MVNTLNSHTTATSKSGKKKTNSSSNKPKGISAGVMVLLKKDIMSAVTLRGTVNSRHISIFADMPNVCVGRVVYSRRKNLFTWYTHGRNVAFKWKYHGVYTRIVFYSTSASKNVMEFPGMFTNTIRAYDYLMGLISHGKIW